MRFRRLSIGLVSILGLTVACSSGPSTRPTPATPKDQYLIEVEELEASGRDNVYDAVRLLRPGWFTRPARQQPGEQTILVYLNERPVGDVTLLRSVSTRVIERARYLSPTEAQVRFGQANGGRPAILLETQK